MRRSVLVMIALALATLVSLACQKPKVTSRTKLVIEDVDVAAWMTFNNSFTRPAGTPPEDWVPKNFWEGVLIQIGEYEAVGPIFESVTFEHGSQTVRTVPRNSVRWINIVADDATRNPPMAASFLGSLYPDSTHTTACKDLDDAAGLDRLCISTAVPPVCPPANLRVVDRHCLRRRSLHGYFKPNEMVITVWHTLAGFDVAVGKEKNEDHIQHSFTFNDKVKIYIDGTELSIGQFDTIRVNVIPPNPAHPESYHGNGDSPPWMP